MPQHLRLGPEVSDEHTGDSHGASTVQWYGTVDDTERTFCLSMSSSQNAKKLGHRDEWREAILLGRVDQSAASDLPRAVRTMPREMLGTRVRYPFSFRHSRL